jgi:hypothetical protein
MKLETKWYETVISFVVLNLLLFAIDGKLEVLLVFASTVAIEQ